MSASLLTGLVLRDAHGRGAIPPPPGVIPNFEHPVSRKKDVVISAIVCPIIAGLFFALRLYTRIHITRTLGWDDYTCAVAVVLSVAFSVAEVQLTRHGLGLHQWDVLYTTFQPGFLKWRITAFCLYWILMMFVKTSILLLYLRIFSVARTFRILTWVIITVVFAYSMAGFLGTAIACKPKRGRCVNINQLGALSSALNTATDVGILVLPIRQVWRLQATSRQKIGLILVFVTGSFVCVVSIVRMAYYIIGQRVVDVTWHARDSAMWTIIEANVGIICACMPALKAFLQHHVPPLFGSVVRSSSTRQHSKPWESAAEGGRSIEGSYVELGKGPEGSVAMKPVANKGQKPEINTISHS